MGEAYFKKWNAGLENFLKGIVRETNVEPEIRVVSPKPDASHFVHVKFGESKGKKIIFILRPTQLPPWKLPFQKVP